MGSARLVCMGVWTNFAMHLSHHACGCFCETCKTQRTPIATCHCCSSRDLLVRRPTESRTCPFAVVLAIIISLPLLPLHGRCYLYGINEELLLGKSENSPPPHAALPQSVETRRVGVLVMPSGAVLEGRGSPLQPKGAGQPGITRKRVGFPLKILD